MPSTEIIVWIVEDDDLYRATLADLITETEGMRCPHTFTTCEAAIGMLHKGEAQDLPDIILMDIGLPDGMSGVEGAGLIKAIIPTSQIIMVTVRDADEVVFEALRAGASGYLLKNAPLDRVLAAIEETHGGGVPMTALPRSWPRYRSRSCRVRTSAIIALRRCLPSVPGVCAIGYPTSGE